MRQKKAQHLLKEMEVRLAHWDVALTATERLMLKSELAGDEKVDSQAKNKLLVFQRT